MQFGIFPAYDYDTVHEAAKIVEDLGMAAVMIPDHYLMSHDMETAWDQPAYDALVQLAGLARDTSQIEIGTLVSPITFRHPAALAKSAVTLDELSGGRFKLGLGAGWMDEEHDTFGIPFPSLGERFDRLEETLEYLRAFFDPSHPGFEGAYYRLSDFAHNPVPDQPVPIMIGGGGPRKIPRLAGQFAAEYSIIEVETFDDMRIRIERARRAAEGAGRDPDQLLISTNIGMAGFDTRREFEDYLVERAAVRGIEPDELRQRMVDRAIPVGTWDRVYEVLSTWEQVGFDRIYLPTWGAPWNAQRTRATLEGLANYG